MNKAILFAMALAMAEVALHAQTETRNTTFQYFVANPAGEAAGFRMIGFSGIGGQVVTGKPLSATEEHQTLQVLGDGTRIENKESNRFYRDSDGRTRVERPKGVVVIQDPVAGTMAELNTENKTVRRMTFKTGAGGSAGTVVTQAGPNTAQARELDQMRQQKMNAEMAVRQGAITISSAGPGTAANVVYQGALAAPSADNSENNPNRENLGIQSINGVTAQGNRTTMTIPPGKIGNDRPIQVVSEQWFSTDLQMLVKSTNSDPRFGETSYQLTNINQAAPDPSLFQVPADYTAREGGRF